MGGATGANEDTTLREYEVEERSELARHLEGSVFPAPDDS